MVRRMNNYTKEERREKLYLDKYIITFYTPDDELVAVFNNPYDMAETLGIKLSTAKATVTNLKKGRKSTMIVFGKRCVMYLILNTDDDDEE